MNAFGALLSVHESERHLYSVEIPAILHRLYVCARMRMDVSSFHPQFDLYSAVHDFQCESLMLHDSHEMEFSHATSLRREEDTRI